MSTRVLRSQTRRHEMLLFNNITTRASKREFFNANPTNILVLKKTESCKNVKGSPIKQPSKKLCTRKKNIQADIKKDPVDNCLINILNYECLIKIFTFLPLETRLLIGAVCRKWKEANKWAWYEVKKLKFPFGAKYSYMSSLINHCKHHITSLTFRMFDNIPLDILIECYNLADLSISITLKQKCKVGLFKNLKKLKNLDLHLHMELGERFDETLFRISDPPLGIERLKLWFYYCRKVPVPKNILKSLEESHDLAFLHLYGFILCDKIMQIIVNKPSLTGLSLADCQLLAKKSPISNIKNLEYLELDRVGGMDDEVIIDVSNGCQKVKKLRITINYNHTAIVSRKSIYQLGRLKNLEDITIELDNLQFKTCIFRQFYNLKKFSTRSFKITDEDVCVILDNSPNLESMKLPCAKIITDAPLRYAESISYRRKQRDQKLYIEIPYSVIRKFTLSRNTFPSIYIDSNPFN